MARVKAKWKKRSDKDLKNLHRIEKAVLALKLRGEESLTHDQRSTIFFDYKHLDLEDKMWVDSGVEAALEFHQKFIQPSILELMSEHPQ